ncbi:hypothetical protein [Mucilaginibacter aquariorum]|uniref:Uncharacterized protein n=1 Tax=Mucilaginibacter aquariorum TaxID=2967225 RepID=A0ABT1SYB2_9SPHI|nr:hypothetical protein [Mucilaginibacter aquariorum]MCQ6957334.1 hypothetical protein [Mucilaginibacter aquariorum]
MIKRKAKRITKPIHKATGPITQRGFGHEMPPEQALVQIYFEQQGMEKEGTLFFKFYDRTDWCGPRGRPYRNWKVLAVRWISNIINT